MDFMKVQKLLTLDLDLVNLLKKEDNASAVVNALLIAHYNSNIKQKQTEQEIVEEVKLKMKKEEERLERIEKEEREKKEETEKDRLEWENTPEEEKQRLIENKSMWALIHSGNLKEEDPGQRLLL